MIYARIKVYAKIKDSTCTADIAKMKWLSSFNRKLKYLSCLIDVFTKYDSVKTVVYGLIEKVKESKLKTNKLLVYYGKEIYDIFMQKWLDDNDILMHSTYNDRKSVNKLEDEYNNRYHYSIGE